MKKANKILLGLLMVAAEAAVLIYSGPDSGKLLQYAGAAWTQVTQGLAQRNAGDESSLSEDESLSESRPEKPDESRPVPPEESDLPSQESDTESQAPEESKSENSLPETYDIEESIGYLDDSAIIHLAASSTEEDMYLVVRDAKGRNAQGSFLITVTGPDGSRTTVETNDHGSTYLRQLKPGLYTLSCEPKEGFSMAEDITVKVKEKVEKKVIKNIEDVVEVVGNDEENEKELQGYKDDKGNQEQGETQEISGQPDNPPEESKQDSEAESTPAVPISSSPEANGSRQDLSDGVCNFSIGPNGYLLLRGSESESDVRPVFTDGLLAYGVRLIASEEADPREEQVSLFMAAHAPVEEYEISLIQAEPPAPEKPQNGWYEQGGYTYYYQNGTPVTGYVKIDGRHYYFNESGVKAKAIGIDVSEWQRISDWSKVKADGIDFVIIRIGGRGYGPSGRLYSDDRAIGYIQAAQAAGLKVGIYFFSAATDTQEAVEEASWTVKVLQSNNIHPDLPVYIDMEHSADYPNGRADQLNRSQHTLVAKAFCETVESSGYEAGIYASKSYFLSELSYSEIDSYSIWLANWTTNYTMPSFSYHYDLWQFSATAKVSGISGNVDIDVIF